MAEQVVDTPGDAAVDAPGEPSVDAPARIEEPAAGVYDGVAEGRSSDGSGAGAVPSPSAPDRPQAGVPTPEGADRASESFSQQMADGFTDLFSGDGIDNWTDGALADEGDMA